ncbi:MAG: GNAT family N-acetyltransferase [Flavobacteriales bacterium]|nr:GNAT family N-acetyltransferase [Flavobacteriales bacterium]
MNFSITLQSDQLQLRPMQTDDLALLLPLVSDETLWEYFAANLSEENVLKRWISTAVVNREKLNQIPFTIVELGTNQVIGSTRFANISDHDLRVEIGWTWLGKAYQGKGYNKEMKLLMLQHCFESIGLERVEFKTDVLNVAARKAMKNLGLIEEGILRSHTLLANGKRRDTIFYSALKAEWDDLKAQNEWS